MAEILVKRNPSDPLAASEVRLFRKWDTLAAIGGGGASCSCGEGRFQLDEQLAGFGGGFLVAMLIGAVAYGISGGRATEFD